MCCMPWHLPWKLNLLSCCLETHTSINWKGSVDIWLSDISRRDGLHRLWQCACGTSCSRVIILICDKNTLTIETTAITCSNLSLRMKHLVQNGFKTISIIFGRILLHVCLPAELLPPPSQRSAGPATPPLRGWSPPCSWAPWCHRWRRVWRSGQSRTPSWPVSSHRARRRGPEEEILQITKIMKR